MWVLMVIAFFRELLGFGSLFGIAVMGENFTPWTIMVMAPSAFFLLGGLIWAVKTIMTMNELRQCACQENTK